jgi:NADH-quinone oxidoreductase subunit L
MLGLTFLGGKSRNPEMHGRVHEAPAVMWVPYVILAAATIGFGLAGLHLKDWFEELFSHYLSGIAPMHVTEIEAGLSITEASLVATAGSLVMLVVGLIPAYLLYIRRRPDPTELLSRRPILSRLWSFLFRRWYINRLYYAVIVYPSITVSRWILRNIELDAIDRFNYALATGARILSTSFRRTHTGILTYNVVAMLLGIAILLVLLIGVTVG